MGRGAEPFHRGSKEEVKLSPIMKLSMRMCVVKNLFLCSALFWLSTAHALENVTLQLKWHHQFQFAGYYAAKELGFYKDAGLDVTLAPVSDKNDPIANVLEGGAQYGVGSSDLLLLRSTGKPLVALAVIFQHSPYVLLAMQKKGIENIHDLIGKRVMIDPYAAEIIAYLKKSNIPIERLVEIKSNNYVAEDLISGKSDAYAGYSTNDPWYLDKAGVRYLMFTPRSEGIDFYGDNLFTTEAELQNHPQRAKAFLEASLKGWNYALNNPEQVIDLMIAKNYFPASGREKLIFEAKQTAQLIHADLVEVGHMHQERWRHIADTYADLGMLPKDFSLKGFLYSEEKDSTRDSLLRSLLVFLIILTGGYATKLYLDRRRVFKALKASETHYRLLTEDVSDVVWKADANFRFTYISPADERMRGFTAAEVIGHHPFEYMTPEGVANATKVMQESQVPALQGKPIKNSSLVTQLYCKDGSLKWAEINPTGERDKNGMITGYHGFTRDITERIRIENELRTKERYQRALLDNFPFAVWLKDIESRFLFVNESFVRAFGRSSADELVGKSDFDIAPLDMATGYRAIDSKVMETLEQNITEELILTDGMLKWFETCKAPVIDHKGKLLGTVGFARDISERKMMEHTLVSLSEEFQRSIGRELHDNLGQIISAIAYQSIAIQNKIGNAVNVNELSGDIAFISYQAKKAISQCKKLAHGLVPFELESSGLTSALVNYAADISHSHEMSCEFVGHREVMIGDTNLELNLFRIVQEAVNNAVRHSGGQHVTISLYMCENILSLSVRDDGQGAVEFESKRHLTSGLGLKIMQYRANQFGIKLKFNYPVEGGTEVLLEKRME
jgi:PAS domain S-box-containing protein